MAVANLPNNIIEKLDFLGLEVFKRYQFAVSIDGDYPGANYFAGFTGVIGVGGTIEVKEVKEGGYPTSHKFARNTINNTLKLVRGMTYNRSLWEWFNEVRQWKRGLPKYTRTMSIIMLDYIPFEVWRFDIINAWPSAWEGPEFNSMAEEQAFETITIQHGGITQAKSLLSNDVNTALSLLQKQ